MVSKPKLFNARLIIKDSVIEIPEIKKINGTSLSAGIGLMFKNKEKAHALLFEFTHDVNLAITSLFCPPFLAIWLNENNKIVEYKIVSPNKFTIRPQKPYRKLIEVPINKKYSMIVDFILERAKV